MPNTQTIANTHFTNNSRTENPSRAIQLRSGRTLNSNTNSEIERSGMLLRSGRALLNSISTDTSLPSLSGKRQRGTTDLETQASNMIAPPNQIQAIGENSETTSLMRTVMRHRPHYIENAITQTQQPMPEVLKQIEALIDPYFHANSNRINRTQFEQHSWATSQRIDDDIAIITSTVANAIANTDDAEHISQNIQVALNELKRTTSITLSEPLNLYVFDTETNRLFGDAISIGWTQLSIDPGLEANYQEGEYFLPPHFITYGAERIHKITLDWLKEQHSADQTTAPEQVVYDWISKVLDTKSAIGFNVLFDLNVMKRLSHRIGLPAERVDALFEAIGNRYTVDAQDLLLRIDPITRHNHDLPFQNTNRHHELAEKMFDGVYENGSDIDFLDNRKLTSYAKGFLGMETTGAHDALFDTRMTLASLLLSISLRNEILENEGQYTRKSDKRLTTYDRNISPAEMLTRHLYPQDVISHEMIVDDNAPQLPRQPFSSLSDQCLHNPALKATPFIYLTTGVSVHRRHIIPKSTMAELLRYNDDRSQQVKSFHEIVTDPLFDSITSQRLSPIAIQICQHFKALSEDQITGSEQYPVALAESISQFIKSLESAKSKGIPLRYFERPPASLFIENLPNSKDLLSDISSEGNSLSQTLTTETLCKVMQAILYSFFHSLEFNQFIGNGADNLVAGQLFHQLSNMQRDTLQQIESAENLNELKQIVKEWFSDIKSSLLFDLENDETHHNSIFESLAKAASLQSNSPEEISIDAKHFADDALPYFLEIESSYYDFFDTFYQFELPTEHNSNDPQSPSVETLLLRTKLLYSLVNYQKSKVNFSFQDRNWINPIINSTLFQDSDLIPNSTAEEKEAMILEFYTRLPALRDSLQNSDLYDGDKALLQKLTEILFYQHNFREDLVQFDQPNSGSLAEFYSNENNNSLTGEDDEMLANCKSSITHFVQSIYDSTAYDIPSCNARALQNSYLLPIFQDYVNNPELSPEQATSMLLRLMQADHEIGHSLGVTRGREDHRPFYSPMLNYIYG